MKVLIGHASINEKGGVSGGRTGDQTGKEICIREWYNKPWDVLLICTDKKLAKRAASIMEKICKNDNYGYDQNKRTTGYVSILKHGISKGKGSFDCSSLVSACYKLAGLDINPYCTTRILCKALLATGKFKAFRMNKYTSSPVYARRGAIYLAEGRHVVMALNKGARK